ncbi:GNAT family N-acetyltransferase [Parablautia sp. Marseille-Q6255]|uniref:GNAT family N-acetyltransferase n=1 Tax=Parablautia sp. Marseille-Q6255 TaxID=3039593 RepID=UPI0024BC8C3B|nr:GNAT family N-acetyltransferase [Parablautia sp. Marseille-Q6255]
MNITIEKASPANAAALLEYLKTVGAQTENLTFGAEGLPVSEADEAAFIAGMAESADSIMLLAKADGKIIGDASVSRLPRRMNHRGEFCIAVAKEYWNRGIGSRLLEEILAFARKNSFEVLDLQVRSDNKPAICLYEKFGFQKTGTHPAFFKIDGQYIAFDYMSLKL